MATDDLPRATPVGARRPESGAEDAPPPPSRRALRRAREREAGAQRELIAARQDHAAAVRGIVSERVRPAAMVEARPRAEAFERPTRGGSVAPPADAPAADAPAPEAPAAAEAPEPRRSPLDAPPSAPTPLGWVDPAAVAARTSDGTFSTAPHRVVAGDLLPARRRASAALLAPVATAGALALAYTATGLLWPLAAVAPTVTARGVQVAPGPALSITWPAEGTAAIAPLGLLDQTATDSADVMSMASITKLATVLMILERLPLEPGEQGPSYTFTWDDYQDYLYNYLWTGQSSLDVPVDGSLTEYQMLEGILLGSANNYADRMMREVWGSQEAFAADAAAWLERNGFTATTIVGPSGIERENVSTSAEVLRLSQLALEHPVIAEIVAKKETTLPGNDEPVANSNPLINDEGVVGVKTGTFLDSYNLATAKQVDIGGETVTVVASVMGQPDAETREAVSRQLIAAAEASLQPTTVIPADTVVASVQTEWGASADIVTADSATLSLWNGAVAATDPSVDDVLGKLQSEQVGTLSVTGSFAEEEIALELTDDIAAPSLWWRLTHPLQLFGLR
ncbi:hypothetical protein [Microbacterium sediminis]|uniref:hypothetical protein n=1 Tax=Microbacterium sediminis TaxID=904291 RepID=UPI000A020F89|nr:hypothetical protein [Microbacterium sediminis]